MPLPRMKLRVRAAAEDATMSKDAVFNSIVQRLRSVKPKAMATVEHAFSDLRGGRQPEMPISLLLGAIQSGKTPAQMLLLWLWCRHPQLEGHACFITKNLETIRQDIVSKLKSDYLNKHIVAVGQEHGLTRQEALQRYGLTFSVYSDCRRGPPSARGHILILLMQSHNMEMARTWFRQTEATHTLARILFVVDEFHELYAGHERIMSTAGLAEVTTRSNIDMLHWIHRQHVNGADVQIVGVTATGISPMSSDAVCAPNRVYQLELEPPVPDVPLEYHGYVNGQLTCEVLVLQRSVLQTVGEILTRPRQPLSPLDKTVEVPLICISTERLNNDQEELAAAIEATYPGQVVCLVMNQKAGISLADFFRGLKLTESICTRGAVVVIGLGCMAAGITIKPPTPMRASYGGQDYSLMGITDQFLPGRKLILSSAMQLMRICGWYPAGHRSKLWVQNHDLVEVYRKTLQDVSQRFTEQYCPKEGAESLAEVRVDTLAVPEIFTASPYYLGCKPLQPPAKGVMIVAKHARSELFQTIRGEGFKQKHYDYLDAM